MNKLSPCRTPYVVPIDMFLSTIIGSEKNSERGSSLTRPPPPPPFVFLLSFLLSKRDGNLVFQYSIFFFLWQELDVKMHELASAF